MIDGSRAEAINAAHHAEVEQRVEQVFLVLIPFRKSPSVILEPDLERPALLISRLFLHVQIADVLGRVLDQERDQQADDDRRQPFEDKQQLPGANPNQSC